MADQQSNPAAEAGTNPLLTNTSGLDPDHPLLRRAQEALKKQLLANKTRLEDELREKQNALKAAKTKRESVGVELYGFQQNLAKLQLALEQTHQNYQAIHQTRGKVEADLQSMQQQLQTEDGSTRLERAKVEKFQMEIDRLSATLKQIEQYNEQMKSEIAVTRRAAYAAEEAVQKLEKVKLQQDFRIDSMQEEVKSTQKQLELYTAQLESQKRETRAALETLAEAESEMESVMFEKKQLVAQWKSSLLAIQKRDEALSAVQDAMRQQQQQEMSIEQEIDGYKRDILKEQIKNEQLTSIMRKVEGDSQFITKQIEAAAEKQQKLQEMLAKLARSLEHTEDQIKRAQADVKALHTEQDAVDRAYTKVSKEIRTIEEEMVVTLSDQTTAEKSSSKTHSDVLDLRKRVREEELHMVETENELAKLQVDILNTDAHNTRLAETLKILDEELDEKSRTIEKYEVEIKRRNDEIEKKTREIDILNKRYEKIVDAMEGGTEIGPLEATIKNLQRELDTKAEESKQLQRRWITLQTELVALQNDNANLAETLTRMHAERTVLLQKKRRLEQQQEHHAREIKNLQAGMQRLRTQLHRVNALIADNSSARAALQEDNFNLENKVMSDLKDMEEEASKLEANIEQTRMQKRDILAEIVEVERHIMLWERKIQLEREMQEVLDPTVGQDVVAEMQKEIHRMTLRHDELMRLQEKLISDMEKALNKRELVALKGRATLAKSKTRGSSDSLTKTQLDRAVTDLSKSIRETEKEMVATDQRSAQLESERNMLSQQVAEVDQACASLRQEEMSLQAALSQASSARFKLLMATTRAQRTAKRLEDIEAGRYKPLIEDSNAVDAELQRAHDKQQRVIALVAQLLQQVPHVAPECERVLAHALDGVEVA